MLKNIPAPSTIVGPFAMAVLLVGAALVASGALTPTAGLAQQSIGGSASFSGAPPTGGGIGLLVTTEAATADALVEALRAAGCDVESIAVLDTGDWRVFVPTPIASVNAAFPPQIESATPFFVRCRAGGVATVDPANSTYDLGGEQITLTDGRSERPVAPGSAANAVTVLLHSAFGDLDGDGATDAAVIIVDQPGGSGSFYYVAVLMSGTTTPAQTSLLGDRIAIDSLSAAHGRIVVSTLDRRFDEPLAAVPTVPVTHTFAVAGGSLVALGTGVCSAVDVDLSTIGAFVFVELPTSGSVVSSGFTVTGCSRTFESTVNWRLLARDGSELASGFTQGGGVDGPDTFSFVVAYTVIEQQVGNLEVFEVDASGGEGPPPPMNVIPLVLRP